MFTIIALEKQSSTHKIFNEIIVELKICVICFRVYFLSFLLALNLFKLYAEDKHNQIIEIFVCYF